jgi:hypothetical protein
VRRKNRELGAESREPRNGKDEGGRKKDEGKPKAGSAETRRIVGLAALVAA